MQEGASSFRFHSRNGRQANSTEIKTDTRIYIAGHRGLVGSTRAHARIGLRIVSVRSAAN